MCIKEAILSVARFHALLAMQIAHHFNTPSLFYKLLRSCEVSKELHHLMWEVEQ